MVQISEISIGEGIEVAKGALVFVHYDGHLEGGTLFDSSRKHGRPFEFVVKNGFIIINIVVLGVQSKRQGIHY